MGNNINTFEVEVLVRGKGSRHYSSHVGMYIESHQVKMFHKDARTGGQAMRMCEKYGRPLSYHKVDYERMARGNEDAVILQNPYPNAIAMDEFIWQKKDRKERIEVNRNKKKDGEA